MEWHLKCPILSSSRCASHRKSHLNIMVFHAWHGSGNLWNASITCATHNSYACLCVDAGCAWVFMACRSCNTNVCVVRPHGIGRHQDRTHNSARTSCNQNIFVCRHANEPVTRAILSPTASFIFDSLRTLSYEKPHRHTIGKPPMLFLQFVLRATRTPHKSCDTHSHMSISVCVCVLYVF